MTHEKRLRRFLSKHQNVVNGLKSVFEWLPDGDSPKGGSIDFPALVSAAQNGERLYTRDTANEFHHFVFAAFVMFGHSLSLFGKAVYLSKDGRALSSEACQQLLLGLQAHTTLILYLITSSAFARHMEVFHNTLGLRELVPDFNRRDEYKSFGKRMRIWDRGVVTGRYPGNEALASDTKADDSSGADNTAMDDFELQVRNVVQSHSTPDAQRFEVACGALSRGCFCQMAENIFRSSVLRTTGIASPMSQASGYRNRDATSHCRLRQISHPVLGQF